MFHRFLKKIYETFFEIFFSKKVKKLLHLFSFMIIINGNLLEV